MKNRMALLFFDMPDRIGVLPHPECVRHTENSMISGILTIFFWILSGVPTVGMPWCTGTLIHAFDIPIFVSWCGVILPAASLVVSIGEIAHSIPGLCRSGDTPPGRLRRQTGSPPAPQPLIRLS